MVNFLRQLENPRMNYEMFFEVFRDFRKGGLSPENYDEFILTCKSLPPISKRTKGDYAVFDKFNLADITEEEFPSIMRELIRRGIEKSKFCWHPEADTSSCSVDNNGKIIVSAAHSIQNNGVLSKIVENGHVMGYAMEKGEIDGKELGKNHASIFWGFCNKHDAIFRPIEVNPYARTAEQNFLFAYRGFVVSSHKKIEVSTWTDFGEQSDNDIKENKKIFDDAILTKNYSVIETEVFELPAFYPIAVSSAFYLDYDFEGKEIPHSDQRMEDIFITLYPVDNKTHFLLSYFTIDKHLYGNLGNQLRNRNNLKSDITMLIAGHTENVYFNPIYYQTFIEKHEETIRLILFHTQMDHATIDDANKINVNFSFTPRNYLDNPYGINFFGY
jgi:hypothetical protein